MNWMNQFAVAFSFILNLLYGKQSTNHLTCYDAYMSRNKTRNKIHQIPTNMCLGCSKTLTCLSSGKLKNYPDHSIYEVLCLSRLGWRMHLANIIFIVGKMVILIYIYIYIVCFHVFCFFHPNSPTCFLEFTTLLWCVRSNQGWCDLQDHAYLQPQRAAAWKDLGPGDEMR